MKSFYIVLSFCIEMRFVFDFYQGSRFLTLPLIEWEMEGV